MEGEESRDAVQRNVALIPAAHVALAYMCTAARVLCSHHAAKESAESVFLRGLPLKKSGTTTRKPCRVHHVDIDSSALAVV